MTDLFISVVIIARNEERTIRDCISAGIASLESAIETGKAVGGEVIFVDSASTDSTLDLAKKFPITILQLSLDWPLSAAAGRHVGLQHANGDLVLFIDGDTIVEPSWLPEAVDLISQPRIAAVCGTIREIQQGNSMLAREIQKYTLRSMPVATVGEVEVASIGLYWKHILQSVAGFHPFLKGAEDLDLGFRITLRGLKILQTRRQMGRHRWSSDAHDVRFIDYFKSVAWWSFGSGQACRYRFRDRRIRQKYLKRYISSRFAYEYFRGLVLGGFLLLQPALLTLHSPWPLVLLTIDFGFLGIVDFVRRRARRTWGEALFSLHRIAYALIRNATFVAGFLTRLPAPEDYPQPVRQIQPGTTLRRSASLEERSL